MKPATLSWCTEMVLMSSAALIERVDELDVAVAAQAEHLRHLLLDQVVDDDLRAVEHIACDIGSLPAQFDDLSGSALRLRCRHCPGARTLFPIILYVNCYCGMLPGLGHSGRAYSLAGVGLIKSGTSVET